MTKNVPPPPPYTRLHDASTIGLYNKGTSTFYLRNSDNTGIANLTFGFGPAGSGWQPIVGDWNGDGTDTIGLYNPATSTFYLRNSNSTGTAAATFAYGPAGAGWIPLAGDWNADGIDTVGLYNPATSTFYLRNTNSTGAANVSFAFGPAGGKWTPVVGDWNGDGTETIGLYNPATSTFYLRNTNNTGAANLSVAYGPAGGGWTPVVGDWNNDGIDTIGLQNPATSTFYLRNTNNTGAANMTFGYGPANSGWTPVIGDWNGVTNGLMAAGGPVTAPANVSALSQAALAPIVHEAIARWTAADLSPAVVQKLSQVQFTISDLSGSYLGQQQGTRVTIDTNAAGHGWFVDATPTLDEEFSPSISGTQFKAIDPQAVDKIDLLTVVEHELGHVLGLDDLDPSAADLMSGTLGIGVRRDISQQDAVDAAFGS